MDEETLSLLIDYILGFSDIFEFDTDRLFQVRCKQNFVPKKLSFKPKNKLISQISAELNNSISLKIDLLRDQSRQQTDAIMYKFNSQDHTLQQLTQQINEKPSQEDLCDLQMQIRKLQNQCEGQFIKIQTQINNQLITIQESLNSYLNAQDFHMLFEEQMSDHMSHFQAKFAPKDMTMQQLDLLECRFHHLSEQLIELKRYTNSNINDVIKKQDFILSDLTTTVKLHEFQEFVDSSKIFATQTQLSAFQEQLLPKIKDLSDIVDKDFNEVQEFRKIIKATDYELLQKATKMDLIILKKEQEDYKLHYQKNLLQIQDTQKQITRCYQYFDEQRQQMAKQLSEQIISSIEDTIKHNVNKQMELYKLEDVGQQIDRIQDFLKAKANKVDVSDSLKLKSNLKDFVTLEDQFNVMSMIFKSQMRIFAEFIELFGIDTDNESMNFKKNAIQKLISDTKSLRKSFSKRNSQYLTGIEDQPFTTRQSSSKKKINTSPKSNGVKLLLRPLLSNTFSVQQAKRNKLNLSMIS
ncbi:unnamed protein product (macronuclear) [Paramecium tetraurelia]|uniref:Uncharacterized protein n=1 Tax=Paramecium tetraurelia TaxID=5888 RepID=A0CBX8_PARTE|nr:uncharacterized protein GSPATT00037078001 [Paramecium tetraurelia]CAK68295.1 unnamed protein product [Paramecium tetraurelia]|eukprot:XP_001435692.1 hypothetical protein (macronuclear) [Paramecium tetraurelia strain d4-2]